ncbi:MAG: SH3 domain-containing protein [Pseudomonadota bacterium]
MRRWNVFFVFTLGLGLSLSVAMAQQRMWVTSDGAKLKAENTASSKTIVSLPIGTEVTVLVSEGSWYRVRASSGEEGWIYRGRLSQTQPAKKGEGETGGLFASMPGSRVKVDEADTARSIRGLSRETEEYAKSRRTPVEYREALDRVLAVGVTEKELEVFLREGKIGEYAP